MKVAISDLKKLCLEILIKRGLSRKDALIIFEEYLESELQEKPDHGFQSFVGFGAKLVEPEGPSRIIKQTKTFLYIDGKKNLGQIVCNRYMPILIRKARNNSIAMMGILNMHSYLTPGTYARIAAEQNMVAIVMNYGGWPRIAPTGSIDPIFGTNPIAIGIPSKNFPIVLDMATSKVALMKVRMAKKLGRKIPLGWAIDKNGKPTTNPARVMEGAMLPFGDYKGSGLALIVELLTKTLFDIKIQDKLKANRGFLFICFDPSAFQNIKKYKSDVATVVQKIKRSRKTKGIKEIFVPGERDYRTKVINKKKKWIELDKKILDEIISFKNKPS